MTKHELDEVLQRRLPSVRELFAAMAMQATINNWAVKEDFSVIIQNCVVAADALLAELAKKMP